MAFSGCVAALHETALDSNRTWVGSPLTPSGVQSVGRPSLICDLVAPLPFQSFTFFIFQREATGLTFVSGWLLASSPMTVPPLQYLPLPREVACLMSRLPRL